MAIQMLTSVKNVNLFGYPVKVCYLYNVNKKTQYLMNVRFINCTGLYVQHERISFDTIEKRTLLRGCSTSLYREFYNAFMSKYGYLNTI